MIFKQKKIIKPTSIIFWGNSIFPTTKNLNIRFTGAIFCYFHDTDLLFTILVILTTKLAITNTTCFFFAFRKLILSFILEYTIRIFYIKSIIDDKLCVLRNYCVIRRFSHVQWLWPEYIEHYHVGTVVLVVWPCWQKFFSTFVFPTEL